MNQVSSLKPRPGRFHLTIATLVGWVAVLGLVLGGLIHDTVTGLLIALILIPSACWTTYVGGSRRARGLPVSFEAQLEHGLRAGLTGGVVTCVSTVVFFLLSIFDRVLLRFAHPPWILLPEVVTLATTATASWLIVRAAVRQVQKEQV